MIRYILDGWAFEAQAWFWRKIGLGPTRSAIEVVPTLPNDLFQSFLHATGWEETIWQPRIVGSGLQTGKSGSRRPLGGTPLSPKYAVALWEAVGEALLSTI